MKQTIRAVTALMLTVTLFTAACKKKDPDPQPATPAEKGSVEIRLDSRAGIEPLVLNSSWYLNENGDSFQVSKFSYYLSNIRLHTKDGSVYTEQESYHLVRQEDPSSLKFTLANVPAGNYTSVSFMIGVDSIRNVSGAQTGALAQEHGMFWDWNSGYIMAKFEGSSPQSPNGGIMYHIGGFSGEHNALRTVTLDFPNEIPLNGGKGSVVINADLLEWFRTPHLIDFSALPTIHMPGANARKISENYAGMFKVAMVSYPVE